MRRAPAQKRTVEPDPVFRSALVSQVINKVLLKGKKDLAPSRRSSNAPARTQPSSSNEQLTTSGHRSRFALAGSVAAPIRFRSRLRVAVRTVLQFDGLSGWHANVVSRQCRCVWRMKFSTPPTTPEQLSNAKKMSTKWQSPTRLSPTTDGERAS